ncbi:ATP-grasp domain-containing protein [Phytohalomonas tamaricis]|uniref:ATP-grasp domain-containing protein n=1 Tax=Phytohalomonas tamaricis TaxID=2081032 RepID=UPI0021D41900|nr:hypothetical protein [Phytohalomonas tamaricis]
MSSIDMSAPAPFVGLAPFLRMSINGEDLRPIAQEQLPRAEACPEDANLWMNLATLMLCLGHHELGLGIQAHALTRQRTFHLAAAHQPARLRALLLMAPGDLATNMPLDCLLEDCDIDLLMYYVSEEGDPLATALPEHNLVMVAMSESDENRPLLTALEPLLADWPKPVINRPQGVANTDRERASQLLQGVEGLLIPPTFPTSRTELQRVISGEKTLADICHDIDFPVIVRPLGSHGGHGLERVADTDELADYLTRLSGEDFFVSAFIDYSDGDGLFRKYRVVLVDGEPFASHMGISSHWMIHYLNAGMYEDAAKRAEEGAWMERFDAFALRHRHALNAIAERSGLDYLCIDCAETRDGELLVFEIGHAMAVHAMDSIELFPHKQVHMAKVKSALRSYLLRRAEGGAQAQKTGGVEV